jgi:hypothetical protein
MSSDVHVVAEIAEHRCHVATVSSVNKASTTSSASAINSPFCSRSRTAMTITADSSGTSCRGPEAMISPSASRR